MENFSIQKSEETLFIRCRSRIENVEKIISTITDYVKPYEQGLNLFNFTLVLRELLNNAYLHGNRKDPAKQIYVSLNIAGNTVSVQIKDDGPGFDWKKTLKQKSDEKQEGGRGMLILKTHSSGFNFNDRGNGVNVRFDLFLPQE